MLRYHMLVVTADATLKRAIKRLTTATGATAEYVVDGATPATQPVDLAIVDARTGEPDARALAALPAQARILYIIKEGSLVDRLTLLKDARTVSLFCHDERFDDDEFISSATKALRGEVFGLQKYFPWGVTTFTMRVKNYDEKGRAIDLMMQYAAGAGVRGPVRDRIQLVADELMMNGLYHAPVDAQGNEKYAGRNLKELARLPEVNAIQVQYGCSGRYFGIAIRDSSGSLARARALEYLLRAKSGLHIEKKATGAGLGLVSVLSSVSKLVFNLAPGTSTEVIGLFDMELFAKGRIGARSLHLFEAREREPAAAEPDAEVAGPRRATTWALAAVLGAGVAIMGTALVMRDSRGEARADGRRSASVIVVAEPATAEIKVNGVAVRSGAVVDLPARGDAELVVTAAGRAPFRRNLASGEVGPRTRVYVQLAPAE